MRARVIVSLLLFLVLSSCLYYVVPTKNSCFDVDSTGYHRFASHFYTTGQVRDPICPGQAPVQTIGYHVFVGVVYKLLGHSTAAVVVVQILLMMVALWLTFLIALFFFGRRVAGITAFLCAINLGFLVYPQFVLAETLLVTMVLASLERFLSYWKTKKLSALVVAGIVGGCSLIVKPSLLLFLFIAALFILFFPPVRARRLLATVVFAGSFLAPLSGYMAYNKITYGYFNLAPMKSLNIYHVFLSKVIARVHGISAEQAEKQIPPFARGNSLDERGWDGARTLFWQYAHRYPGVCVGVWLENVAKTTFGLYVTQLKLLLNPQLTGGEVSFFKEHGFWWQRAYAYIVNGSPSPWVAVLAVSEAIWSLIRYILALLALIALLYHRRYATVLFFIVFIACGVLITGTDGCCRYRIVVEPMLMMLAALGSVVLCDYFCRGKTAVLGRREHAW